MLKNVFLENSWKGRRENCRNEVLIGGISVSDIAI